MSLVDNIIGAESGGNPYAQNSRSSAGGLGQFIDPTWLNMLQKYRPDLAALPRDQQLQLKYDPAISREMTQRYADENSAHLKNHGFEANPGNVYLAHFAGPDGAVRILNNPQASAAGLMGPAAAQANPFLRNMSGADLANWAARKGGTDTGGSVGMPMGSSVGMPMGASSQIPGTRDAFSPDVSQPQTGQPSIAGGQPTGNFMQTAWGMANGSTPPSAQTLFTSLLNGNQQQQGGAGSGSVDAANAAAKTLSSTADPAPAIPAYRQPMINMDGLNSLIQHRSIFT